MVRGECKRLGIQVTQADVDKLWGEWDSKLRTRSGGERTLRETIKEQGTTEREFVEQIWHLIRKERIAEHPSYLGKTLPEHEHSRLRHLPEVGSGTLIDLRGVRIRLGREIDLRLRYMQEAPRATGGTHTRLVTVENIIGRRHDVGGAFLDRPQTGKWAYQGHGKTDTVVTSTTLYTATRAAVTPNPSYWLGDDSSWASQPSP